MLSFPPRPTLETLMADTSHRFSRRALLGGLGLAAATGGGLLWQKRPQAWRSGFTMQLLPALPTPGLQNHLWGLHWVIQAHLETLAPACLIRIPNPTMPFPAHRRSFQLQLQPMRLGNLLALGFRFRRADAHWQTISGATLPPRQALAAFLAALPEPCAPDRLGHLLPPSEELTWELLTLASQRARLSDVPGLKARMEQLIQAAPDCALARCLHGAATYQDLFARPDWRAEARAQAEGSLNQALTLLPGLPFAAAESALMYSDFGENRPALEVLSKALAIHPNAELLLRRLAYTARNGGLLDLARRACQKREACVGFNSGIENTHLYLGALAHFEAGVRTQAQHEGLEPSIRFYLGYISLLRGDQSEALQRLKSSPLPWGNSRFGQLGYALCTFLEGQRSESRAALEGLVQQHLKLRAPDGEFILKLAELMALHGELNGALDLCVRAASHGFGCVPWYEQSPFLTPVRGMLKFQALLQTLRERQAAMASQFPVGRFGL